MADISWAKERVSSVTYWSVLLFFGIAATATLMDGAFDVQLLASIVVLAAFGLWWVKHLHDFAAESWKRVHRFLADFPSGYEYPSRKSLSITGSTYGPI
jgi:hypothetical protein